MPPHHTPEIVFIQVPILASLAREYEDLGHPINVTVTPRMLREARGDVDAPADSPLNDDDHVIKDILDLDPGVSRSEIEKIASRRFSGLPVGCVHRRMAAGMPLRTLGYHTKGQGRSTTYWPPEN